MGNCPVFLIKGRKVGNSIVLTAPKSAENQYYTISLLDNGKIIYTPIRPHHLAAPNQKLNEFDEVIEDV